jgi:hypothetical protein
MRLLQKGQFGIFLLLSYAAGHFIAALGNVLESVLWRAFGGMPSDWVTTQQSSLLSPQQIVALETKVTSRALSPLTNRSTSSSPTGAIKPADVPLVQSAKFESIPAPHRIRRAV